MVFHSLQVSLHLTSYYITNEKLYLSYFLSYLLVIIFICIIDFINICDSTVGISESDADRVTDLAGWMWGTMYQDDMLNRLAIGRFLRELLDVMHPAVHDLPTPAPSSPFAFLSHKKHIDIPVEQTSHAKMMIFSGHDSTLVPVLCALGIYEGTSTSCFFCLIYRAIDIITGGK